MTKIIDIINEDTRVRCPGMSYTDLLELDTRPVPDILMEESAPDIGTESFSTERYTSEAFAEDERQKMWRKVWLYAAREEDLSEPGETVVYNIAGRSYLLVRQEDMTIKAFHNVCLHRGRMLRNTSGRSKALKCAFHGFTWNNDGSLKEIPCEWDFKHLREKNMSLPELRVELWHGFVMVTENDDLPPFKDWVGPGVEHFDRWRLEECYTAVWVGRKIKANWKVAMEAFLEAFHSITTHPQILSFTGDANTRYDLYGDHMNRGITPTAVLSPHLDDKFDQNYVLEKLQAFTSEEAKTPDIERQSSKSFDNRIDADGLKDPVMARKIMAENNRKLYGEMSATDLTDSTDSEVVDSFTYNMFPNFAPWGGFIPNIVYRWRPGDTVDECLMEIRILVRLPEGTPKPKTPAMFEIGDDEPFSTAAHLLGTGLAGVFDQDVGNLQYIQKGLKASANKTVEFSSYQESRLRHFNQTLDKYLSK